MRALLKKGLLGFSSIFALTLFGLSTVLAEELSEKSVRTFMEYAWSLTPQQFSKQDGTVIVIDKKKKEDVFVPLDVAREVIKVGRISAHAQVCGLPELQVANHRSLMKREEEKKTWSEQQLVYINQLHLTTVMLLTGRIRLVEKEGDKEVVIDEGKSSTPTCTDEQRGKVKDMIVSYIESGPNFKISVSPLQTGTSASKTSPDPKAKSGTTSSVTAPTASANSPPSSEKPQIKQ
ncbi:MAG: hypothetical protein ACKOW3_05695 [Hyphomicrobium sp.]